MAAEVFRARCMRCGDAYDCDPADPYLPEICHHCFTKGLAALDRDSRLHFFVRFQERYRKGAAKHPTWRAIDAWHRAQPAPNEEGAPF